MELKSFVTRGRLIAAGLIGFCALVWAGFAIGLSFGPMDAPWLKPMVREALQDQVVGGKARLDRVRIVWTARAHSLGLELDGVTLVDGKGRDVIRAKMLEAGIATDALGSWTVAPGRVRARDFFVATSISPKGEYALGYDASGVPHGKSQLGGLIDDIVGAARHGRPASFVRDIDLANGRLALRQVRGTVAWVADVRTLQFEKAKGRLRAQADVSLNDGSGRAPATLNGRGVAAIGLRNALAWGRLEGLTPARVFPSVGATEQLSRLDALVGGRGSVSYDFKDGVRAADLTLQAGKGTLALGDGREPFESADLVARYNPQSGEVEMTSLHFLAERTKLDLTGRFRLVPEDTRRRVPARLDISIAGPRVYESLSVDAPPQELTDVSIVAVFTPEAHRLELQRAHALLAGSPVDTSAVFWRDKRERLGVRLQARLGGVVTPAQVFAFWPQSVVTPVRGYLKHAILQGRLTNAAFVVDSPPGIGEKPILPNSAFRISFDFQDAAVRYVDQLAPITAGVGKGLVQGNRFDLSLSSGKMENVALSEGVIEIPAFKPDGAIGHFKARAIGEAREIMTILDRPPLNFFTHNGFSPSRVTGRADVRFQLDRPMLFEVPAEKYKVKYQGVIHNGGVTEAALGWDMTNAELKVDGDQDKVLINGVGVAGPYRGKVELTTRYQGRGEKGVNVAVDGFLDAWILGGKSGARAPFAGKFREDKGAGSGVIHSAVFDGRVNWKDGNGADRVILSGWGLAPALRKVGTPLLGGAPDRFPVEAKFGRNGDVWRGPVKTDALTGIATYWAGARPRLLYQADVSPIEARRLGLGKLPLFEQARQVVVDASWAGEQGAANVRAGPVVMAVNWNDAAPGGAERRLRANLSASDMALLGLPTVLAAPGQTLPVSAVWRDAGEGMSGAADVDGTPIRFQATPGKGGAMNYQVRADLDRRGLRRWGVPDIIDVDGTAALTARWASIENRASAGRVDIDLTSTTLSVAESDWKKPGGQAAHLTVDFLDDGQGSVRLTRISGSSVGSEVEGSALMGPGGHLVTLDLTKARLNGLIDSAVRVSRDNQGMALSLRGRWLDARRLISEAAQPAEAGGVASGASGAPVRIDAQLDGLRFTDEAVLREVKATGVWGPEAVRRMDVTAQTSAGSRMSGRLYPLTGGTALQVQAANAGDAARTLLGVTSLKGGTAVLTGRLVEGGADLNLQMKNVRLVKAPTMAQILTLASLRGLADTLNGEGVLFTVVDAPVQVRGRRVIVGESRATGSALGLTTRGVADLNTDTLDFQGSIAPAYSLNAAVGHVPVLGQILTSRKGEGVVGLGYSAKGSFEKPQVSVNPLSVLTPGILRRMFEAPPVGVDTPAPAPKRKTARTGGEP